MKLILLRNNLKEGLGAVSQGVGSGSHLPVLKNVLLRIHEKVLEITSTNLEIGVVSRVSAKILVPGSLTVPFHVFNNVVVNADSERITLETEKDEHTLRVTTDNYNAAIQGTPDSEFPIIPTVENTATSLEINSSTLKRAFSEVVTAARISEIHPEISGVLFDFQLSVLKFVATDSFRLSEKTLSQTEWKSNFYEGWRAIVPLKTIQEVLRVFPDNQILNLYIDPGQILFKTDSTQLISRLIDGQYPDYERIIPKDVEVEMIVSREKLMAAVKLVGSFSGSAGDIVLRTSEGTKAIELYSSNNQVGENRYLIPAKIENPKQVEVVFNWKFLLDGLKPYHTETVTLGINSDGKPAVIKNPKDTSLFYILMPIRSGG